MSPTNLTDADILEALEPANAFERRKRILEALDFEDHLLDRAVTLLEVRIASEPMTKARCEILEERLEGMNNALRSIENADNELIELFTAKELTEYYASIA